MTLLYDDPIFLKDAGAAGPSRAVTATHFVAMGITPSQSWGGMRLCCAMNTVR